MRISLGQRKIEETHFCQTPGLVLSLRVDFVLPLSQQEQQEQQEQQQEPSPKSIIILARTNVLL